MWIIRQPGHVGHKCDPLPSAEIYLQGTVAECSICHKTYVTRSVGDGALEKLVWVLDDK